MDANSFMAMVIHETEDKKYVRRIDERRIDDLPAGEVLIRVRYSSLNYKDALSASGNKGVTRRYPHTPGVDAAGEVAESSSPDFKPGEEVLVTGYDLGMNTDGGFGQYIRVPAAWVVPLPKGLTLRESMIYGTAGFTAAQSVWALIQHNVTADRGDVLVTGATGSVGSLALATLAKLGYSVYGSSGKPESEAFLRQLGAKGRVPREEMDDQSNKPLLPKRWAGVVDTVGGNTLATALKVTDYRGSVTTCGNVGGGDISTTVYPFILRGIRLIGIDSANCPYPDRLEVWKHISGDWKLDILDDLAREGGLEDLDGEIDGMLKSRNQGRLVVRLWE